MNSWGNCIRLTLFGQSHGSAIGMTLDGIPAGYHIDFDRLQSFMDRRAPGRNELTTKRREDDVPEFLSGLSKGFTCGAPITAIIRNRDIKASDYDKFRDIPRPGHADYTSYIKYGEHRDISGGGHLSGRITASLCIAGGICLQLLSEHGIEIAACIDSIGSIKDNDNFNELIKEARSRGDSVGGTIECVVSGLPAGLGDPIFGGMENRISSLVFGIPAVKGIEFGSGFDFAAMYGSEANDEYYISEGKIKTKTNNCGGILGGITNGMELTFKVAIKPTPSIAIAQRSVKLSSMEETELTVSGRHDPCIVPRAMPCVEAAAALAVYDALLSRRMETNL
ncbi:MAG: chorismate synthase [Clostridiales bacterium]|nr:chorismate synthase [Clostridiales bacterium]